MSARTLFLVIMAMLCISCGPKPESMASSAKLGPLVMDGAPQVRDLGTTTETVWNCGEGGGIIVKHPEMSVVTNYAVEWEIGGEIGFSAHIGDGLIPGGVDLSTTLEGRYMTGFGQGSQQGTGWDLPAEPDSAMVYHLMWREVWQPGYLDVTLVDQSTVRVNIRYRTGIQSDVVGKQQMSCDQEQRVAVEEPAQQPIVEPSPTARVAQTVPPSAPGGQASANCGFIQDLIGNGDVVLSLDVPSGSGYWAGVQIRLLNPVTVPQGWIVQRGQGDEHGPLKLSTGTLASVWSPEECRPLAGPFRSPTDCSFLDLLATKGNVLQWLYYPEGTLAGAQVQLAEAVNVPRGWIVQRGQGDEYGPINLPAGAVASFWSPVSCRPLGMP